MEKEGSVKLSRVELLIKASEDIKHKSLNNALKRHIEEETMKQEELLLRQFKQASLILDNAIQDLRNIRKREQKATAIVSATDKAMEQFKIDGDYEAFVKAIRKL